MTILVQIVLALSLASAAHAQPTFSEIFSLDTIGPGSVSTLTFTITTGSGTPIENLAFSDTLPTGVILAIPANPLMCPIGNIAASAGGSTSMFMAEGCVSCVLSSSGVGLKMYEKE